MESLGVLILRLMLGLIFVRHGQRQFSRLSGGTSNELVRRLGLRPVKLWDSLSVLAHLGGGILIALGALTVFACALIVTTMSVATISKVQEKRGFWEREGGYEYNLFLMAVAAAIALMGPGLFSVDAAWLPGLIEPKLFYLSLLVSLTVTGLGLCRKPSPAAE